MIGDVLESRGHMGRLDHESVGGPGVEPLLHRVGDVIGRTDHVALGARTVPASDLADGQLLALGELHDLAVMAFHANHFERRERTVEVVLREIDVDVVRQAGQAGLVVDEFEKSLVLGHRVADVGADDSGGGGQDLELLGIPAVGGRAPLHVLVKVNGTLERLVAAEHDVGPAGGEVASRRRRAGLHDDRVSLRRPGHAERPLYLEETALVVDRLDLLGTSEAAGLLVVDQRVVGPGIPQAGGHLEELLGPRIPLLAIGQLVLVEVLRLRILKAGDDVPPGASATEVIERTHGPREVVRLLVAGRHRRGDTEPGGHRAHQGDNRHRVQTRCAGTEFDRRLEGVAETARYGERVGHERHVELGVFEDPGDVQIVLRGEEAVPGVGMPPTDRPLRAGIHECGQVDLLTGHVIRSFATDLRLTMGGARLPRQRVESSSRKATANHPVPVVRVPARSPAAANAACAVRAAVNGSTTAQYAALSAPRLQPVPVT